MLTLENMLFLSLRVARPFLEGGEVAAALG